MIELAAVAGPRFELRVVGAAAGLDRPRSPRPSSRRSRSGIVEELPERRPPCRFTHELVRRAVYDRIPRIRRPELHLRVGEALERAHAADLARVLPELAHHFTLAAPVAGAERGVDYNLRAAEAAIASVAYREAAARLSTALELGIADPRERPRVQAELGHLLYESGRVAESEAVLAASLDAATGLGGAGLAARALVQRSNQRLASRPAVSSAEMFPIAEEAIATFEQLGDPLGLAVAEHLLGHALGREGRSERGLAALERALAHAEAAGDQVMRRHIIGRIARELCDGPTPGRRGDRAAARSSGRRARTTRCSMPGFAAASRSSSRWPAASTRRGSTSRPASDVLDRGVQTDFIAASTVDRRARRMELAGDLAGAEQRARRRVRAACATRGARSEARALRVAAQLALLLLRSGPLGRGGGRTSPTARSVDRREPVQGKVYCHLPLCRERARRRAARGDLAEALDLARRRRRGCRSERLAELQSARLARAGRGAAGQRPTAEADAAVATALALYEQKGNVAAAARTALDRSRLAGM